MIAIGALGAGALIYKALKSLPNVQTLGQQTASSMIYDEFGKPVTLLWGQESLPVPLSKIPKNLQNALVATEDHRFWTNSGVDFLAILRAAFNDLTHHHTVSGASTITEQLGKIHYLTDNRSISYKIAEVLLGLEIAHTYTKSEILDMYLNQVYLGEGATGVGAASEIYFSKPVSELSLAQSALLAGLPQAPSAYDPLAHYRAAKKRQWVVLQNMVNFGYITRKEALAAYHAPLYLNRGSLPQNHYKDPWFVDAVVETLLNHHFSMHELSTGGLKIYTTLNPAIEQDAVNAVAQVMNKTYPLPKSGTPEPEAAVVVMNPRNGYVLALVGGRQHTNILGFNRATDAYRQTGSAIKPLAEYPAAIEMGYTAATVVDDGPFMLRNGTPWPQNDNHKYLGRITFTEALAQSDNNAAVRVATMVGINNAFDTATRQFGLPLVASGRYNDKTLAMAIGGLTRGVTPLDMAAAYTTYANGGYRATPILVTKVVARDGRVLYSQAPRLMPEISPQVAYIMTTMMEAVVQQGTGQGAKIGRPQAGKTGTAENGQDGWFVGYVPQMVAAVWEGYDHPKAQSGVFGATFALPIWKDLMEKALANVPPEAFPVPKNIVQAQVDTKSGLLPSPLTPPQYVQTFDFIANTQPTSQSNVWVQATVDAQHPNELWSPACLPDQPVTQVFLQRPSDILIGPGLPLPEDANLWVPTQTCSGTAGGSPGSTAPTIAIQNGQAAPTSVTVKVGAPVSLTIQNADAIPYTFDFPRFGVGTQTVPASGSVTVNFTPTQAGTYPFTITPQGGGPQIQGSITVAPSSPG